MDLSFASMRAKARSHLSLLGLITVVTARVLGRGYETRTSTCTLGATKNKQNKLRGP
jgi:hypothetical protein